MCAAAAAGVRISEESLECSRLVFDVAARTDSRNSFERGLPFASNTYIR